MGLIISPPGGLIIHAIRRVCNAGIHPPQQRHNGHAVAQDQAAIANAFFLHLPNLRNAARIAQERAKLMVKYIAVMPAEAVAEGVRPHNGNR
jgi:hypothetical protein